jgi:hypothetical protein
VAKYWTEGIKLIGGSSWNVAACEFSTVDDFFVFLRFYKYFRCFLMISLAVELEIPMERAALLILSLFYMTFSINFDLSYDMLHILLMG